MFKKIHAIVTLVLVTFSVTVVADIYWYDGPFYEPGDIAMGAYSTTMRVSGYIVTNGPIPPNQTDFNLASVLVGYSFFDGLQIIDDSNAHEVRIQSGALGVSTDAEGNLTYLLMSVSNYLKPDIQLDEMTGNIQTGSDGYSVARFTCTSFSTQCDTNPLTDFSISQSTISVDWTREEAEIVSDHHVISFNSTAIGWSNNPAGKSGLGQSFVSNAGGTLQGVSFKANIEPEAIAESEDLIVEFWNVDESGLPTGSPLATRTVAASGFLGEGNSESMTVDFVSDNIALLPNTSYAVTFSVANKADAELSGMYFMSTDVENRFASGEMLLANGGGPWFKRSDLDMSFFIITAADAYIHRGGFEAP